MEGRRSTTELLPRTSNCTVSARRRVDWQAMTYRIRPAEPADVPAIVRLIQGLAEYEGLPAAPDECRLREHLFGDRPWVEALVAEEGGQVVGFALFFSTYSTFLTQPGIYLEDLYVEPRHRRRGIGRALLSRVAAIAVARGCARLEWAVLRWNAPAIAFYDRLGAVPLDEWQIRRLSGEALHRVAALDGEGGA
ncbi:MAG: GNAT family N-acetyltransferase [Chloroflexota bacterium]|nr:GNAT family N-acetyltransferase [Dehalococcoidia bacterium]MDW8253761.1 GNAT family N-acetyltransferase [Chloroflexota bacterium]